MFFNIRTNFEDEKRIMNEGFTRVVESLIIDILDFTTKLFDLKFEPGKIYMLIKLPEIYKPFTECEIYSVVNLPQLDALFTKRKVYTVAELDNLYNFTAHEICLILNLPQMYKIFTANEICLILNLPQMYKIFTNKNTRINPSELININTTDSIRHGFTYLLYLEEQIRKMIDAKAFDELTDTLNSFRIKKMQINKENYILINNKKNYSEQKALLKLIDEYTRKREKIYIENKEELIRKEIEKQEINTRRIKCLPYSSLFSHLPEFICLFLDF